MNIPYPCPKPLEEMKSTKNGFYCNDCGHTLIDIRAENSTLPPKGSCVVSYEEVEDEKTAEINKSYRFALALFIVMGGSMILNNSAYSQEFITSIDEIRESSLKVDSSIIYINGNINDFKGRPLKQVNIKITLANGQVVKKSVTNRSHYSIEIPAHQLNKSIKIEYVYYIDSISIEFLVLDTYNLTPEVQFKRNTDDKYIKKRYEKSNIRIGF